MNIRIMSDLHNEFHRDLGNNFEIESLPQDSETTLILAGDIEVGYKNIIKFLTPLKQRFKHVIYIFGNHEFYGDQMWYVKQQVINNFKNTNIHILDNTSIEIEDVNFIGSTLWTDLKDPIHEYTSSINMNDFKKIKYSRQGDFSGSRFNTSIWQSLHSTSIAFIKKELEKAQRSIVVSHHLPSFSSVSPIYLNDPLNGGYASELSPMILKYQPEFWIHGHTHTSMDYHIGTTNILCNPAGYVQSLNTEFSQSKIIII
jgi:predicted phosphodiesterase